MSSHSPILPDPLPLREALRGLRHVLRRGGHSLTETLPVETLPEPAAKVAEKLLREAESLARNIDTAASSLAKFVLGDQVNDAMHLNIPAAAKDGASPFATSFYVALQSALPRLGVKDAFVSEIAAYESYEQSMRIDHVDAADLAADLMMRLLENRVLRDLRPAVLRIPASAVEAVAVFAVLLWQQSNWSYSESEEALDAATDIAIAINAEVAQSQGDGGPAHLAALFRKYACHV